MFIIFCKNVGGKNLVLVPNYDICCCKISMSCSKYVCYQASIFLGANIILIKLLYNFFVIFLGNFLGGEILVAELYALAYKKNS